eukprot:m.116178 g.116178  ORF g.116178 m.116178 type:complete len:319 (-) comp23024_c1_seq1:37-993(-)
MMSLLFLLMLSQSTLCSYLNRVGFHLGPGGNHDNIGTYMEQLDAAGLPFVIKDVDEYAPLAQAAALRNKSGIPHVIIWRNTNMDSVNYNNPPAQEALDHWQKNIAALPAGFDKTNVWLEVINEPDQTKCDWLGQFGVTVANLSMAQGYKVSMFGFATGNPPVGSSAPNCWEAPGMLDYLRIAGQHPDVLGVALHEYALTLNITSEYPWLVGRFHFLYETCENYSIPLPTTHITEFGWTGCNVKLPPSAGIADIDEVMRTSPYAYAKYPSIKGAFIWYLGPWHCDISDEADQLVLPVLNYTIASHHASLDAPLSSFWKG